MQRYYEYVGHVTVTITDFDGNQWARLKCRGCLLKDRRKRLPVWVPKGKGSGLCQRCGEIHREPVWLKQNPNLAVSEVHRRQYDGEQSWDEE